MGGGGGGGGGRDGFLFWSGSFDERKSRFFFKGGNARWNKWRKKCSVRGKLLAGISDFLNIKILQFLNLLKKGEAWRVL